jgi:colicin import membrane protein
VREKQETERKQKAEVEKQRQAEAQAESERKRVADIKRRQDEEAQKRKAAEDARALAAREAELKNQMAEEEGRTQAENAGVKNAWGALIEQHIYRNWNRPPSARPGIDCEVNVTQTPTGTVLSVKVGKCNCGPTVHRGGGVKGLAAAASA